MADWAEVRRAALAYLDPEEAGVWRLRPEPAAQLAIAAFALLLFAEADRIRRMCWLLDGSNLLIHEFGHPFFSLLFGGNRFMMFVGGTATQLLFPLLFYGNFLTRGMFKSADVCLLWFGENFLHIAPYAADARSQLLPLVGGGEHDWHYLLGVFGLLDRDKQVGHAFDLVGCAVIAFGIWALCAHWKRKAKRPSPLEQALWSPD